MDQSHPDSQQFFLSGKAFHRINQFPFIKKTYSIKYQSFRIALTKEQTLLLSTSAFKCNKRGNCFVIEKPPKHILMKNFKCSSFFGQSFQ
jgi:hypothetical protein